jgi:hypothetical protein
MKSISKLVEEIKKLMKDDAINIEVVPTRKGNPDIIKIGWTELLTQEDAEELVKELRKK